MRTESRIDRPVRLAWACAAVWLAGCSQGPALREPRLDELRAMGAEVSQDRLMTFVRDLSASHGEDTPLDCSYVDPELVPFPVCHLTNAKTRALVTSTLQPLGLPLSFNTQAADTYPTTNVIAELPGLTKPEEVILVGAHFDAFYQGADDNSTGVAAVVELARVLSNHRFDRTIRFVAFDLEEPGFYGSSRYVDERAKRDDVALAVIFDGLGYYSTVMGSQVAIPYIATPTTGDFLAAIGNGLASQRVRELLALNDQLGVTRVVSLMVSNSGTSTPEVLRSDHTPFWIAGKEALFLTDTGPFRNPNYHRSTDLPDTLDSARFTQAVQLSAVALGYWAGGPR